MKKIFAMLSFFVLVAFMQLVAQEEARLLRFPAVSGNQLVFSYAGDLYTTGINGGTARKLTSHNGYEMFPKFSPDGSQIAFTGSMMATPRCSPATGGGHNG